jgi:hypothetical protein
VTAVRVVRDVAASEPHNYLHRDVKAGEVFYAFTRPVYGSVDFVNGVALSEAEGEYPFFEFPRDAVEVQR